MVARSELSLSSILTDNVAITVTNLVGFDSRTLRYV